MYDYNFMMSFCISIYIYIHMCIGNVYIFNYDTYIYIYTSYMPTHMCMVSVWPTRKAPGKSVEQVAGFQLGPLRTKQ